MFLKQVAVRGQDRWGQVRMVGKNEHEMESDVQWVVRMASSWEGYQKMQQDSSNFVEGMNVVIAWVQVLLGSK